MPDRIRNAVTERATPHGFRPTTPAVLVAGDGGLCAAAERIGLEVVRTGGEAGNGSRVSG
jgi:hypothetical protein